MRKSFQALCVAVTLAMALSALGVAPALATSAHVFFSSFGEAGSGDGQLALVEGTLFPSGGTNGGVAVNSTTHDVYVADTGNHRVDEFSSSGVFIRAWGWGVADGSTEALQTCTSGCHAGLPGSGAGQLTAPTFIAVDNSGGPSAGAVYVADRSVAGSVFVVKFSATGGYISSNDGSGVLFPLPGPFRNVIGGITVDSSGDLWILAEGSNAFGDVFEFAQDGSFITDWSSSHGDANAGIAVDSAHDLYLLSLSKYSSSGALIGSITNADVLGVAVDSASGDLYADEEGERVAHYAPSCEPANGLCTAVDSFGSGGELSRAEQLTVDSGNDTVYVSDVGHQRVAVFGRTPDVTTGTPASRTPTAATVNGTVNPDNTAVNDCHFDYVSDGEYQAGASDPYAAGGTVPCDVTPAGAGPVTVHAETTGLTPGAAYHFRLQAANVYGASFGADETIPGTPPAVLATSAADVSSASAQLRATLNPDGGDTTYRFEYGTTTGYGANVPVPDADIGSGVGSVPVARRVQGLLAGTTYHYRVVAHNLLGNTFGPDRTIVTQLSGGNAGTDTCPNAPIRAQQHAATLPDCRAYEQVSPPNRDGAPILGGATEALWQASADGSSVFYTSPGFFADAQAGAAIVSSYLSSRSVSGWSTHSLLPPQAPGSILPFPRMEVFSSDLSKGILIEGGGGFRYGQDEPLLVAGEPLNNVNLFLRDNTANLSYQLIDVTPPSVTPADAQLEEVTPDLTHVFFSESAQLTPDAPPAGEDPQLYEWSGGTVRLVGILPGGAPVPASEEARLPIAGVGQSGPEIPVPDNHAVSSDGSRVFFQLYGANHFLKGLYLRQSATSTVQVDAARGSGSGGQGAFTVASSDGSQAFFLDDATRGLTNDTVPGSGTNLYRYDANSGSLSDLTPVAGAEVMGVLGASEDGSYVYFVANGVLAPGATPGDCQPGSFATPQQSCNLYLFHNGTTTFIAALNGALDGSDWGDATTPNHTAVVSPDGRYLAFQSRNILTGYDNLAANGVQCGHDEREGLGGPQQLCGEVFLYDAAARPSERLHCASCNPSGGAPVGSSLLAGRRDEVVNYMPRYLSDSGRVFFNSFDALVPQDVNGQWDVYEYEPAGDGSCGQAQGCVALISSGRTPNSSFFRDASVSGEDVFFTTADELVAQDGDQSADLYDARVDGGLASQNEAPAVPCSGEACKPPASGQPAEQTSGSSGLSGQGNLTSSAPVSNHKKPAKKKHHVKKKRHPKKRRHARGRRANHNRGGAK